MSLQSEANRSHAITRTPAWLWVLLVAPLILTLGLAIYELMPVPMEDDYHVLLDFGLQWRAADWAQRVHLLLVTQHNDYKLVLQELMVGAEFSLTHHLALAPFMWTAYGLLLLCVWLLWRHCAIASPVQQRLWLFVPVVWTFANLSYAEALDWAMGGMQQVAVVAFSVLALSLLTRGTATSRYGASVASVLAYLSSANAFAMAPIGLILLWKQRRWGALAAWMCALAFSLAVYFWRFQVTPHPRPSLGRLVLFFFAVTGSALGYHGIVVLACILGVAMLAGFVRAAAGRMDRTDPFFFWLSLWIIMSLAMASAARSAAGMVFAISSRYHIYSELLLCLLYLMAVNWMVGRGGLQRFKAMFPAVLALAVVFGLSSDGLGLYLLRHRRADIAGGLETYAKSGGTVSPMSYPIGMAPERAGLRIYVRDVLNRAEQTGLYRLPDQLQAMCPPGSACDTVKR